VIGMNYSDILKYAKQYMDMLEKFILESSKLMLTLNEKIDHVLELLGGDNDVPDDTAERDDRADEANSESI